MKRTTLPTNLRKRLLLIPLLSYSLLTSAEAVSPPPDGGYANGNTAEGDSALLNLTTGLYNTAIGLFSLRNNTTGSFNTGVGAGTLLTNTGVENTAVGAGALLSNTTGRDNTATGESALFFNTTGRENTANGANALLNNTTGNNNTATGFQALASNTTGGANTANGLQALANNTTGGHNTANGYQALRSNTIGSDNIATGFEALRANTTGSGNTGNGATALRNNATGNDNTAVGNGALFNNTIGDNTAVGARALSLNTTGAENTALGVDAGRDQTTGSGNVYIGRSMVGVAGESNKTYIRNINFTGLDGAAVTVDVSTGLLGHATSSRRYKEEIQPMDQSSEALYQLNPVTFRYKKEINRTQAVSFGLIAEEVAEVNPDLILRDTAGRPETVRYDAVNAMLLNEFLKEHRHVQEQDAIIARQQKQIEALTAGLEKVTAHVEASKPAARTVLSQR
jgi:Chaperone of endosialidase